MCTSPRQFIEQLDSLPYPDWEAIDMNVYRDFVPHSNFLYGYRYMSVCTSRGCPYHCTFCHNMMGKRFRAHSPARVIEELRILQERFGISHIEILDDIFNCDRQRAIEIMRMISESGMKLKIYLVGGMRGDILDEETVDRFSKSGVVYVAVAVETGSQRMQKEIKKYIDLAKLKRIIAYIEKKKIFVHGFFMLGFPQEKIGDILLTIFYACRLKLHTALFVFCRGYKGTELGDLLPAKSIITPDNDTSSYMSAKDFVNCSQIGRNKLILLKQLANMLFFINPFRIFRIFRDLPSRNFSILSLLLKKFIHRTVILK
jgi:radical SAM superfamily enzyme YgiQ (UPF0313 family)